MKKNKGQLKRLAIAIALALISTLAFSVSYAARRDTRADIQAAWQRVRVAGSYRFSADIVQTTIPLALVTNVGRPSKEQAFHLEGSTNLPNHRLELTLDRKSV